MTIIRSAVSLPLTTLLLLGCPGDGSQPDGGMAGNWWQPTSDTSWQWQLVGSIDQSLDVTAYDVDLLHEQVTDAVLADLKADGRIVVCYFSAGTWENWREDAADLEDAVKGSTLAEWPDERWLDVRAPATRAWVERRLDQAVARGCDAVEPDNLDAFDNDSGFNLTAAGQLAFNQWVAEAAHSRGLSVGLKNDLDQLEALEPFYDWALNEGCAAYDECDRYAGNFVAANKAVFHAEYIDAVADGPDRVSAVCGQPALQGLSTLIKEWDLTAWRLECP